MNSDKYVALASKLIAKNGRAVAIKKFNSSTGWKNDNGTFDELLTRTLMACFIPASSGGLGTTLATTDMLARVSQVCLIAPTDTDLSLHNVVTDNSVNWKIEWVQVLNPADKPLLYVMGLTV